MLIELKNKRRLPAIDIFRGLAIAVMLLVNSLPNFEQAYPLLLHAPWAGLTLADLAFPGFVFIMGTAGALWFPNGAGSGQKERNAIPGSARSQRWSAETIR